RPKPARVMMDGFLVPELPSFPVIGERHTLRGADSSKGIAGANADGGDHLVIRLRLRVHAHRPAIDGACRVDKKLRCNHSKPRVDGPAQLIEWVPDAEICAPCESFCGV